MIYASTVLALPADTVGPVEQAVNVQEDSAYRHTEVSMSKHFHLVWKSGTYQKLTGVSRSEETPRIGLPQDWSVFKLAICLVHKRKSTCRDNVVRLKNRRGKTIAWAELRSPLATGEKVFHQGYHVGTRGLTKVHIEMYTWISVPDTATLSEAPSASGVTWHEDPTGGKPIVSAASTSRS